MRIQLLRTDEAEILDLHEGTPRGQAILDDLDRWNRLSGWYEGHVRAVERWWQHLDCPRPFRVLDVGTGPGALLEAIGQHFETLGVQTELVGLDRSAGYVQEAQARLGGRARIVQADATDMPFDAGSFHLGTTALMIHHLPHDVRHGVVSELRRVCGAAYVFDLELTFTGALGWGVLATLLGMGSDTRHDGVVSVRRACTREEMAALLAPLPGRVVRRFPTGLALLPA